MLRLIIKTSYDRVKIDFGQEASDKTIDELIKAYKDGNASTEEKAYLETMIFQYGRYLQISSSREGDKLPANLQEYGWIVQVQRIVRSHGEVTII